MLALVLLPCVLLRVGRPLLPPPPSTSIFSSAFQAHLLAQLVGAPGKKLNGCGFESQPQLLQCCFHTLSPGSA